MSDFALQNLKEVDDAFADHGLDGEARFGRKHLGSEHLGVSYFRYGPTLRSPVGLRVAPPVVRSFEAGPDGLELIAVGSDRPEGGDGEMVEGHWSDG